MSLPITQTFIAQKVVNYLNEDFGIDISIEKIHLKFNADVALKGVLINDFRGETLIAAKEIETSILNFSQLTKGNLYFGTIDADSLVFNMKTHKGDTISNLDVFVSKFDSDTPSEGNFIMKTKKINLKNSHCYISDHNNPEPMLFQATDITMEVKNFAVEGSNVFLETTKGGFLYDKSLKINELHTKFSYTDSLMSAEKIWLETDKTTLEADLKMIPYKESFSDFVNKVIFDTKVHKGSIASEDLNAFYNGFSKGKTLNINHLKMYGTLNNFLLSEGKILYQNTSIEGNYTFQNLLSDTEKIIIKSDNLQIETIRNDLATLMPVELGENLPNELQKLEIFRTEGRFQYNTASLDTHLNVFSNKGNAEIQVVMNNLEDTNNATYSGKIITQNLQMGDFISEPSLGGFTSDFTFDGKGFDPKNLRISAQGKVHSLHYNKYSYKDISVETNLENQLFSGKINANDQHLKMIFDGEIDFSTEKPSFDLTADIQHADLKELKFLENDSIARLKTKIHCKLQGNSVDNITGNIHFKNTEYSNSAGSFLFNHFDVTSSLSEDNIKEITFNSTDIISGNIKGRFKMAEVKPIIQNAIGSIYTHYKPYKIDKNQFIDFNLNIHNKIIEAFAPQIKISNDSFVKGKINADQGSFKMLLKLPEVQAFDYQIDNIKLEIDNQNPIYKTYFEIEKANVGGYNINDFNLISTNVKDTLFFRSEFKGGNRGADTYELNFFHTLNQKQEATIEMKKSEINFRGNLWTINPNNLPNQNKITINSSIDSIKVQNFKMLHRNQHLNVSALLTDNYKNVHLVADNVSLEKVLPEIEGFDLKGTINGYLSFVQRGKLFYPSSDIFVRHLRLNGYDYGDLEASIFGNDDLSYFDVNAHFINGKTLGFRAKGNIQVDQKLGTLLDLKTTFEDFNLAPFSPMMEGIFYDLRGWLNGDINIGGTIHNPTMNGELSLKKAGVGITYLKLNTDIQEDAKILVENQTFKIQDWTLTDTAFKTQALFTGSIRHKNLSDWFFDLKIDTQNKRFLVLNTPYTNDALFYGKGFIKGNATIKGAIDEIVIAVKAVTEEGTEFKIPLSDTEGVGDDSFITFVEKGKKVKVERSLASVKGLELKFDMDVMPNAEVEIIMDKKTGSNLVGRGEGTLLIEINTNGKFNMWGDFITYSGFYNFKYENLIDKRFTVLPGGSISWSGDPLKASLRDLKAAYTLNANPSVLLKSTHSRKIPTQVVIKLEGELMQPQTLFDITFPDSSPSLISELNYRLENQDRKQLQAFSLLAQGSFMSEQNTDNRLVAYNLFETAAGLFNQLLSDEDNKLNLGVSYEAGITDASSDITNSDRLGFTLSTQITEKVLFNAKVGIPVGGVTRTAVAGNAEAIFQLNESGNLTAKLFVRENEWQQYLIDRVGYTYGTGVSYSVDFNTFKELIHKLFGKNGKIIEPVKK